MSKVLKQGLGLLFVVVALVGCSSSGKKDQNAGQTGVDTSNQVSTASTLDNVVYFDFDESTLRADSRALLLAHAEQLKASPRAVRLEGHADERGTREYNMALAERRANAVRDFLVLQGVSASQLESISYGEERPAVTGSNESSWAQNRRVELK